MSLRPPAGRARTSANEHMPRRVLVDLYHRPALLDTLRRHGAERTTS